MIKMTDRKFARSLTGMNVVFRPIFFGNRDARSQCFNNRTDIL